MNKLEKKIAYSFKDSSLLQTALTHSSYANERHGAQSESYERLEFLGDSILGLVTADFLYKLQPSLPEGRMTRLRAELVCEVSLHEVAQGLGLGAYMRLGRGEERSGGRERPSIMADMVEAVIAAIYLDGGLDEARRFIMEKILSSARIDEVGSGGDYKTALQELVQQKSNQTISYEMLGQYGPDHNKMFEFRVLINGRAAGDGRGRTKKEAEQMAAKEAMESLRQ